MVGSVRLTDRLNLDQRIVIVIAVGIALAAIGFYLVNTLLVAARTGAILLRASLVVMKRLRRAQCYETSAGSRHRGRGAGPGEVG